MNEMEGFTQAAVCTVAASGLPVQEKRALIHKLFVLEGQGDTGFTNGRTLKEMVECKYTFLFEKEEMYDYKQRKAYYDVDLPRKTSFVGGSVYPCKEDVPGLPGARGKLCVDSGSIAWQAMVDAGKITGEGAEPLTEITGLLALGRAYYLMTRQNGEIPTRVHWGLCATFFLTDAHREALAAGASQEEICELLGITPEQYNAREIRPQQATGKTYPAPAKVYYVQGELTPFTPASEEWGDGSYIFLGYRCAPEHTLYIRGTKLPCLLTALPPGAPARINPFALGEERVEWLENSNKAIADIERFSREVSAMITPGFQRDSSPVLRACLNWDSMRGQLDALSRLNNCRGLGISEVLSQVEGIFFATANILENARIPESVLGERTAFTALLAKLKVALLGYLGVENHPDIPQKQLEQFSETFARLTHLVETALERQKQIATARAPRGTPLEVSQVNMWAEELERLEATGNREENARRAILMDNLWKSRVLFLDEQAVYAAKALQFYRIAGQMIDAACQEYMGQMAPAPEIDGQVMALEVQLDFIAGLDPQRMLEDALPHLEPGYRPKSFLPVAAELVAVIGGGGVMEVHTQLLVSDEERELVTITWKNKELIAAEISRPPQ